MASSSSSPSATCCRKQQQLQVEGQNVGIHLRGFKADPTNQLCIYYPGGDSSRENTLFSEAGNLLLKVGIALALLFLVVAICFLLFYCLLKKKRKNKPRSENHSHTKHRRHSTVHSKHSRKRSSTVKKHSASRAGQSSFMMKSNARKPKSSKFSSNRLSGSKKAKHF